MSRKCVLALAIILVVTVPSERSLQLAAFARTIADPTPVIVEDNKDGIFSQVTTLEGMDVHGQVAPMMRTDVTGRGGTRCNYAPMGAFPLVLNPAPGVNLDSHAGEAGAYWFYTCPEASGINWVPAGPAGPAPLPRVTPAELARQASSLLPLPDPVPRTAPDRSDQPGLAVTVVNVHTWLWLDRASWGTRTKTTAVPGLRVTVTATPVRADWDLGEGRTISCGPGTPWRPEGAGADGGLGAPSPDCDYRFVREVATALTGRRSAACGG